MLVEHLVWKRNGASPETTGTRFTAPGPSVVATRWRRSSDAAQAVPARRTGIAIATAALGAAGVASGIVIAALPSLQFAYSAGLSRVASESALAVISLLAAGLVVGTSAQRAGSTHQYLCAGVVVLAACAVLQMVGRIAGGIGVWWAMYAGTLGGGALLAMAAWIPERRPLGRLALGVVSLGVLAAAVAVVHLVADAPRGLADMASLDPDRPYLDRPLGILGIHLMSAVLFAVVAVGLARRATRAQEPLMGWLAMAAALEAVARLHLLLFPPVPNGWLHVADLGRLGFAVLLLIGAARSANHALVVGERRRIAHDLHDGLAQELAFIRRRAPRLSGDGDGTLGQEILDAAQRADEQARRVIDALAAPREAPLVTGLTRDAAMVAGREGVPLVLALSPGADARRAVREALVGIAGEAVANAARHGHAETVRVELTNGEGLCLRIADDGVGFDPEASSGDGYGLASMRERAEAIGATLVITSRPGSGTEVRVEVP